MKNLIALALICQSVSAFQAPGQRTPVSSRMSMGFFAEEQFNQLKKVIASSLLLGSLAAPSLAADYAPATPPPQLIPQVARQSPKAVQAGTPEKWIYSKFLDEVEKNNVEKVRSFALLHSFHSH